MNFKEFDIHASILQAVEEAGFKLPTKIQEEAIPKILEGKDLFASAQTGTGKTAAFILPGLHKLSTPSQGKGPRILVLVPTRELAMQVATESAKFSKYLGKLKTICIFGGTPYPEQVRKLDRPYDILVATPGRLIDHVERGRISFDRIEMFIVDEADRMLDMGFIEPLKYIASLLPKERQTLLFSATLDGKSRKLSKQLLQDPIEIAIETEVKKHTNIEQKLNHVDDIGHKHRLLEHHLGDASLKQIIVFSSTKSNANHLALRLKDLGYMAAALHGDMPQNKRTRTIMQMRKGKVQILVATDVAARGIDVPAVSHVLNFDLPMNPEDYVHRIGRTGRAGASGTAISFVSPRERELLSRIEEFTGQKIQSHVVEGMEPSQKGFAPKKAKTNHRKRKPNFGGNNSYFSRRKEGAKKRPSTQGKKTRKHGKKPASKFR